MSNHNRLEAEYMKYVRQSEEWSAAPTRRSMPGTRNWRKKALCEKD